MNKLTDAEILKALECCGNIVDSTCKECAYHKTYNASCVVRLMRDALDLINRYKAEAERLQTRVGELIRQYNNDIENVESRVIQDFAKKLKKRFKGFPMYNYSEINNEIDTLVHFYPCIKKITAIKHDSLCETETYKGGE